MHTRLAGALLALLFSTTAAAPGQTAPAPAETHIHKPAVASTVLTLTVGEKTVKFTPEDLAAMPQRTISAHNGHTRMDEIYTGVAVSNLLAKQGITLAGEGAKKIYHAYLRATGTDNYWVLYSASELEDEVHQGTSS